MHHNFFKQKRITVFAIWLALAAPLVAQNTIPEWCRPLPRPEYKNLEHIPVSDAWFEVYKPARDVFAIYEPHQAEEVISYLIVGKRRALLFDTGMHISDIKKVAAELTKLPIIVLNSHTHNDHVGGNWQFNTIHGMDTDFTRKNARGSREDAQAEITPDQICGALPNDFNAKAYATRPWKITAHTHNGDRFDLGGRTLEVIATPGHTSDAISLIDRSNGLLFTGHTYYPARSALSSSSTRSGFRCGACGKSARRPGFARKGPVQGRRHFVSDARRQSLKSSSRATTPIRAC